MSDVTHKLKQHELAGFDVIGYRQKDGRIALGGHNSPLLRAMDAHMGTEITIVDAFPEQVELLGAVWTLEYVKENEWEGRAEAERTNPDDPRLRICWGIYV